MPFSLACSIHMPCVQHTHGNCIQYARVRQRVLIEKESNFYCNRRCMELKLLSQELKLLSYSNMALNLLRY